MDDDCTYRIEVQGRANEDDLNAASPFQMTVVHADAKSTRLAIRTDQSGLIGLLRYLHGRGLMLLSVTCEQEAPRNT
jgi:hypothetical protein